MPEEGSVSVDVSDHIGSVTFHHPKKNSLPGALLRNLAGEITRLGADQRVRVILLSSRGDGPFCAGASFDELLEIDNFDSARMFFMGFAQVILAMRKCPQFVVTRVQGKAVGGGVGLIAASDYVLASNGASIKLSEFALGFGPFVIGPAVERKVGAAAFSASAIDTEWRDALWARRHGLFSEILDSAAALDEAFQSTGAKLAASSPKAIAELKKVFWADTKGWDELLPARAEISARLVLSDFTNRAISAFKKRT